MGLLEINFHKDEKGGTELMGKNWQQVVVPAAPDLADWHWCIIPGDNLISPDNSNIVWIHASHDEPDMNRLLDKKFQKFFKAFVFVSNWQYEMFWKSYQLPTEKCFVLRNAIHPFEVHQKPTGKKLNLFYHPNPIRGLDILLESFAKIDDPNLELNIYHELDVNERKKSHERGEVTYEYSHVSPAEEEFLNYCLQLANQDNRVIRHPITPNRVLREHMKNYHIFAYPTYFSETSCISMMEALASGCSVLSSNLAALPETGMGFARHYGFTVDRKKHIERFTYELINTVEEYRNGKFDNTKQVEVCNYQFGWEKRKEEWIDFSKQLWRIF